jgi:hypothetical protein
LHEGVGEKKTDSLRLLVVVGGHGAFVAAFRNRAEIVLAHLYPQFAEPAAPALAQRPHSLSRRHHVLSLRSEHGGTERVCKS